jgi:thiol:disulfide interchange protein DsbA
VRAAFALVALACLAGPSHAQDIRARQNIEYRLIAPQPVESGDRIEVIDLFWYGCPACNALQPELEAWVRRMPPDVALRRVPAILRDSWSPHARIYYALEQLKEAERLHLKVYYSYHVEKLHMSKPDVTVEWAAANGIDRKRWLDAYHSPEVDARVERAQKLSEAYTVAVTPTLVVDGRYLTSGAYVPGADVRDVVSILDDVIRLARQNRGGR